MHCATPGIPLFSPDLIHFGQARRKIPQLAKLCRVQVEPKPYPHGPPDAAVEAACYAHADAQTRWDAKPTSDAERAAATARREERAAAQRAHRAEEKASSAADSQARALEKG